MRYLMALCCVVGLAWPLGASAQVQTPSDYDCSLLAPQKFQLEGAKKDYALELYKQCQKSQTIGVTGYDAIITFYDHSIQWYKNEPSSEQSLQNTFNTTINTANESIVIETLDPNSIILGIDKQSLESQKNNSVLHFLILKLMELEASHKNTFIQVFFKPYHMASLKKHFEAATNSQNDPSPSDTAQSVSSNSYNAPDNSNEIRSEPNKINLMSWLAVANQLLPWLLLLIQAVLIMGLWRQKQHLDTQSEKIRQLKKQVDTFTFQLSVLGKTPLNEYIAEKFKAFYQQKIKGLQSDIDNLQYRSSQPQQESQSANPPHEAAQAFSFSEQAFSHPVVFTAEDWLHSYQHNTAQAIQAEEVIKLRSSDHNQRARRQSAGMVALQECSSGQFYFAYPDSESSYWVVPSMDKAWLPNIQDLQGLQDLYLVNEVPDTQRKRAQIIQILQPARMHKDPGGHWTLISQGQLQLSSGA